MRDSGFVHEAPEIAKRCRAAAGHEVRILHKTAWIQFYGEFEVCYVGNREFGASLSVHVEEGLEAFLKGGNIPFRDCSQIFKQGRDSLKIIGLGGSFHAASDFT